MKPLLLLPGILFGIALTLGTAQAQAEDEADQVPASELKPRYLDLRVAPRITGDIAAGKAKAQVCSVCHGDDGYTATAPSFPNIGGQHADFAYWQLVELKRGRHPSPMTPLVSTLSDQDMRDMAVYYASLPAPAAAAAPAETADEPLDTALVERGHVLYLQGDTEKGIPPCQGCHGSDARGMPGADSPNRNGHTPYASFPSLRGQHAVYLQSKLAEYHNSDLRDSTSDFIMGAVGKRLDAESIQAVSAWLSTLPHD